MATKRNSIRKRAGTKVVAHRNYPATPNASYSSASHSVAGFGGSRAASHQRFVIDPGSANDAMLIEKGLPVRAIDETAKLIGGSESFVLGLVKISGSTFARRKKKGTLGKIESDRVYRLRRITKRAIDFFEGNVEATQRWLRKPASALGGKRPIDIVINDAGVKAVDDLLVRLDHGVFT